MSTFVKKSTLTFVAVAAFAMAAQAHVTIRSEANGIDSISGKTDTFRLVAPNQRDKDIVEVRMQVADNVKFLYLEPVAGWTYTLKRDDKNNIVEVTYKGIAKPSEMARFPFIARNPDKNDTIAAYKAWVKYADGVVVPFDGSDEAKGYQPRILVK